MVEGRPGDQVPSSPGQFAQLEVSDFGAVRNASIGLNSLTVFVGKNVTAKSYLSTLVYAIWNTLGARRPIGRRRALLTPRPGVPPRPSDPKMQPFTDLVQRLLSEYRAGASFRLSVNEDAILVPIEALTQDQRRVCDELVREQLALSAGPVSEEISRCFGSELANLVRRGSEVRAAHVSWRQSRPPARVHYTISDNKATGDAPEVDLSGLTLSIPLVSAGHRGPPSRAELRQLGEVSARVTRDALWTDVLGGFQVRSYYLPAARSGILHTHRIAAGSLILEAPLAGLKRVEVPLVAGTVTDFLAEIVLMEPRRTGPLARLARQIEKDVLHGTVTIRQSQTLYPEIVFTEAGNEYPLYLSSSMVSELAPLVLEIRHLIQPGDLLILEEPESHVHPGAQVSLARAIVGLVRAGVRVLITTHSDFLLSELNNFLRTGALREKQVVNDNVADYLIRDEVSAYLFIRDSKTLAVDVRPLGISPEFGIPSDEFDEVASELHERAVQGERALHEGVDPSA